MTAVGRLGLQCREGERDDDEVMVRSSSSLAPRPHELMQNIRFSSIRLLGLHHHYTQSSHPQVGWWMVRERCGEHKRMN